MKIIFILFSISGVLLSFFYIAKPKLSIELQIKFYESINWRMTPISISKEVRNTRIMGAVLLAVSLSTFLAAISQ